MDYGITSRGHTSRQPSLLYLQVALFVSDDRVVELLQPGRTGGCGCGRLLVVGVCTSSWEFGVAFWQLMRSLGQAMRSDRRTQRTTMPACCNLRLEPEAF